MVDFINNSNGPGSGEHIFGGDVHIGNAEFKERVFNKYTRYVASKKNITISLGGDTIETITPNDKRYSIQSHGGRYARISAQVDHAVDVMSPIADRVLWVSTGNHEDIIDHIMVPAVEIGKRIGVPGTASWVVKAQFPCFNALDWHGDGVIGSRHQDPQVRYENECRAVKERLNRLPISDCDVAIMHHIHKVRIRPPSRILHVVGMDGVRQIHTGQGTVMLSGRERLIPEHYRWYASSGAMLGSIAEGYSTYAEKRGLGATTLSYVRATWKNDKFIGLDELVL